MITRDLAMSLPMERKLRFVADLLELPDGGDKQVRRDRLVCALDLVSSLSKELVAELNADATRAREACRNETMRVWWQNNRKLNK